MLGPHTPATAPAVEFQRAETGLSAPEHRSSADRPIRCHWRCFGASGRRLSGVHSPCGRCAYVVSLATAWASFAVSWMTQVEGTEGQRSSLQSAPPPPARPKPRHRKPMHQSGMRPRSGPNQQHCLLPAYWSVYKLHNVGKISKSYYAFA